MQTILGQTRALQILQAALGSGRFHHAWIFSGPRGVGKFSTAMNVARILLDPEMPPTALTQQVQIPKSKIQNHIDAGTHPDIHIIRKEDVAFSENRELREKKQRNIPIDLLRERIIGGYSGATYHEAVAYRTAVFGHAKVFIIDEAELLEQETQNVMLKTLEEPPADTYFFLITSQPDELFPTIRSRCQHVRFGGLSPVEMKQWLRLEQDREAAHALDKAQQDESNTRKKDDVDPTPLASLLKARGGKEEIIPWILEYAEGAPGLARIAVEYGLYLWKLALDPMLAELERGQFPTSMGETMGRLVEEFAQSWVKRHGPNTSKDAANKEGAGHLLAFLAAHVRRKLAQAVGAGDESELWLNAIELIREAERQIDSNVNQKLALENLVVQWSKQATVVGAAAA